MLFALSNYISVASELSDLSNKIHSVSCLIDAVPQIEGIPNLRLISDKVKRQAKKTEFLSAIALYADKKYCTASNQLGAYITSQSTPISILSSAVMIPPLIDIIKEINSLPSPYSFEIKRQIEEYIDILQSSDSSEDKMRAAIKWLEEKRSDVSTVMDYAEWITGSEIKLPSPLKDGMEFIEALDLSNKFISGSGNYFAGIISKDMSEATSGAKDLYSVVASVAKSTLEEVIKDSEGQVGLIVDYGKNMVSNWIESIQTETTVGGVYYKTFANSAVELFEDTVCNTPTLAIAYVPAKAVTSVVGFDLQGAYEKVSDKKGFAAVTDSFEQMSDLFRENSTWDNWKSGVGVIWDGIKGWF